MKISLDQYTLLLGYIMPLVVAVIVQRHWTTTAKTIVGALLSAIAAAIQLWIEGKLNSANLLASALAILALSISFFKGFWKPLGVASWLETVTSPPTNRVNAFLEIEGETGE